MDEFVYTYGKLCQTNKIGFFPLFYPNFLITNKYEVGNPHYNAARKHGYLISVTVPRIR
jgi:hypothetical protein